MVTFYPHIDSLYSAAWVSWVLLVLGVCLFMVHLSHPDAMREGFYSLFSQVERRYHDSPKTMAVFFSVLFCMGTLALMIDVLWYQGGGLSIEHFWSIMLVTLVYQLIKVASLELVGVFFLKKGVFGPAKTHYFSLCTAVCVVEYVLLIVAINFQFLHMVKMGMWLAMVFYFAVLLWKLFRTFTKRWYSVVYILLYFILCEVAPAAGVYYWVDHYLIPG